MMRCFNMEQKGLYQKYSNLSKEIAGLSKVIQTKNSLKRDIWKLISDEGIWRLPIKEQYGGQGLNWQDYAAALSGLFAHYHNDEMILLLMSQSSVLYLILRYADETTKIHYLSPLIKGEMASLLVHSSIYELFPNILQLNKKDDVISCHKSSICIHVERLAGNISFYVRKNKIDRSLIAKLPHSFSIKKNKLIPDEDGIAVLSDLINFQRLFYSILATNFSMNLKIAATS